MTYTYDHVGSTRDPSAPTPPGFRRLLYTVDSPLPFAEAVEVLFTWEMHRRAGLRPVVSASRVEPGAVVVQRFGPFRAPCRVVWAYEEPDRAGFAYGTLPGHPECGEESFTLTALPDGGTRFAVKAHSRPGRWYTRLGGPFARFAQARVVRRYGRAFAR